MRPVLLSLHLGHQHLALHSYGVAIAAGFMLAIWIAVRNAARLGEDAERVRDLCFWLLVSSMLGARALFVATNVPSYVDACRVALDERSLAATVSGCTRPLHVWEGGLVFFGGLIAAIGVAWWFTRKNEMSFWRIADALAPSVALGHFFGRLGCWAAGCCWGAPTDSPLGVRFPPESLAFENLVTEGKLAPDASATPPLHPVQLYEAGGLLVLFIALGWLGQRKRYDGQVLVAYLIGYSILRFCVEILRGDAVRRFVAPGLSTSQAIAIVAAGVAVVLAKRLRATAA
jgi:phosphatidylglycerol:prolipoprotein diacylglycerol transferase